MRPLSQLYLKLGRLTSKHPYVVIGLCLLVTAACCAGMFFMDVSTDPQKLWVNPSSRSNHEQNYFQDQFGKFYRVNQVIFSARDSPEDTDIFQKEYLQELWNIQSKIESATILHKDQLHTVDSYCYKPVTGEGCFISSPMDYWKMNVTKMLEDTDIKYTAQCIKQTEGQEIACSDRNNIPIIRNVTFGGVSCEEGTGGPCEACKIKANAMMITFLLNNNDENINNGAKSWEKTVFEKYIDDYNDGPGLLTGSYYSERSISDELDKEDSQNFIYVVFSYVFMFLYISLAIGHFPSRLHTRFMLGFAGIFIVICSVCISIGLTSFLGLSLSMISIEVVPFLILAIGVDNMFIISMGERNARAKALKHGEEDLEHSEIMGRALSEVGPSITAAAVSEFAAFMVGVSTGIPALTNFCITAAIAVMADFLLQVTGFMAVLELDHRRRTQRRLDCFPCFDLENAPKEPTRDLVQTAVRKCYVRLLFLPIVQVILFVIFIAIIVLSFVTYDKLDLGLTEQVTVIKNSNLYNYFNAYDDYSNAGAIAYIVVKDINYTNEHNRNILDNMSDELSQMTKTVQPPVYSWIKGVTSYINNAQPICNNTDIKQYDYITQVKSFLKTRIDSVCCRKFGICGEQYVTDIIFDETGESIVASRFRFQHTALKKQSDYISALRDTRNAIDKLSKGLVPNLETNDSHMVKNSIDWTDNDKAYSHDTDDRLAFGYSLFYVYYDQYASIRGVALENLFLAFAAVFFSIELLTLNTYAALLVTLMVAGTSWGLIAFCYLWNKAAGGYGTEINAVSVVNLVMCCGLAVEFCVHINTAFLKVTGTRPERAKKALIKMGSTVMTGIVSTKLIGVIVLGFAPSEVFRLYYFRMYLGIIILGFFHGLAFQPIMLSYIGPNSEKVKKETKGEELLGSDK